MHPIKDSRPLNFSPTPEFFPLGRRIKGEVELVEVFDLVEAGGLDPAAHQSAGPHVQFILQDQFQKLGVIQPVAARLVQADFQALGQARKPKLF